LSNRTGILLERINPRVDRKILILISGLIWCGVGRMLMVLAEKWMNHYSGNGRYLLAGCLWKCLTGGGDDFFNIFNNKLLT